MANRLMIAQMIVWNWWMAHWADRTANRYRQDSISALSYERQLHYEAMECSAREKADYRQRIADTLTLLLILPSVPTTRPASTPRLVTDYDGQVSDLSGKPEWQQRNQAASTPVARLSVAVADLPEPRPVVYGGSLDTELGLAECLRVLNGLQVASEGRWLDDTQGEEWRNG